MIKAKNIELERINELARNTMLLPLLFSSIIVFLLLKLGLKGAGVLMAFPIILYLLKTVFSRPDRMLFMTLGFSFFISGLSRYIKFSWGLGIDILLVVTCIILFIKEYKNLEIKNLNNTFFGLSLIWMAYVVFLIVNPESHSIEAWFYAMRGVGFYFLLTLGLSLMTLRKPSHVDTFLKFLIGLSVLGAIWAIKQKTIGVDSFEHHWLWVEGHYDEHVLFGVLRAFSFYSDAGQFGASQIMISMMCGILLFQRNISLKTRLLYATGMIMCFIGFALSGSRGPMIVPAVGGLSFLVLTKNFKILSMGAFGLVVVFCILKFTFIAHGLEPVRRMRTALDPENPSLMARKRNQDTFAAYLKDKPIGGGIGSAGYWGNRFSPDTLLANTPTDSYYVKIWAETGIVGVGLHVMIIGYFLGTIAIFIDRLKNTNLKYKAMALYASIFGVLAASYGNQVFSQLPTGIIMAMAFGILYLMPVYDKQIQLKQQP